jgi:membrane protease YdiL (CAAX protease family)
MFVTKAKFGKNEWWRYLLVLILLVVALSVSQLIILSPLAFFYPDFEWMHLGTGEIPGYVNLNLLFIAIVLPFALVFGALYVFFPALHMRPFSSLITPYIPVKWMSIFKMAGIFLIFLLSIEGLHYVIASDQYTTNFQGIDFVLLIVVSVPLLFFQTGLEEIVFRGYLYQGFAILTKYRFVAAVFSSLFFAAMHMGNPETYQYDTTQLFGYYFLTAIFLSILTIMEDNLYLAWAFHYANNFVAAVFFNYKGSALNTYSLFKAEELDMNSMLLSSFISFSILILAIAIWRRWKNWGRLTRKIHFEPLSQGLDF